MPDSMSVPLLPTTTTVPETISFVHHQEKQQSPIYINPDQISDMNHVRWRNLKTNSSPAISSSSTHLILTTGDDQLNDKETDIRLIARFKHDKIQIVLLFLTALFYFLHTLRAYIPATAQLTSQFWSTIKPISIRRIYTSDLRPSIVTENLLLRLAENWQTFWLFYVLSHIPRRTDFGYLYRNPNTFHSLLCILLIGALSLQLVSQWAPSLEYSCTCLSLSLTLLCATCRLVTVKLSQNENKYKTAYMTIDLLIIRYFVLNSLFFYTTSIAYSTMCACVELIGIHLDPTATLPASTTICMTIGLSMIFIFLVAYFLLDLFVYNNEFWPVWTPYIFIATAFVCPPLRRFSALETDTIISDLNYYLLWTLFITAVFMICIRIYRQLSVIYRQMKKKSRIPSYIDLVTTDGLT